jgi:hypothetical protein
MRIVGMMAAFGLALGLSLASPFGNMTANAATISETIGFKASRFTAFNGTPVPVNNVTGSFRFTLDDTKSYTDATSGLVLQSLNLPRLQPVVFSYDPQSKMLTLGANGHANQYVWGTNDFALSVLLNGSQASGSFFGYSEQGLNDSFETYRVVTSVSSPAALRATVATVTPIPGSVLMLLTALGVLSVAAMVRPRTRHSLTA